MPITLPSRLSYSSLSSYAECGERWKLERGYGLSGGTWWATVAGSAIHDWTELWDREFIEKGRVDASKLPSFETLLDKHAAIAREKGDEIKASGRVLKEVGKSGGPNKKDRDWWLEMGPEYLERYVTWRKLTRWEIPTLPDGKLGIEVKVFVNLGGESVLGFIDRVFIRPDGQVVIVDIKSGNEPASKIQLGVYSAALLKEYGIQADWGTYWMGGDGETTPLWDMTLYSEDYIESLFAMARRGLEAGVFLPNVTAMCRGCGVRDHCRAVGGRLAGSLPVVDSLERRPPSTPRSKPAETRAA